MFAYTLGGTCPLQLSDRCAPNFYKFAVLIFSFKTSCHRICSAVNAADWVSSLFAYCALNFATDDVSRALSVFTSNAHGLKLNFYEPFVDMPCQ